MQDKKRTIVITGASTGLGRATVLKFAQEGNDLVLIARDKQKLENVKAKIEKTVLKEMKLLPVKCDIKSEKEIGSAMEQVKGTFGKIDILINNAGIRTEISVGNMSLETWDNVIRINLTGTFLMTKYALPLLRKSDTPVIINISSVKGLYGGKNLSAYSASKFGVIGFTQSLAEELKGDGIKVYAVCPAAMDTDMIRNLKHNIPKEKLIQPDEVANIIYEIATNSHELTGQTIIITGRQKEVLEKITKSKEYKIIQWD